jgi:hypothetical protein
MRKYHKRNHKFTYVILSFAMALSGALDLKASATVKPYSSGAASSAEYVQADSKRFAFENTGEVAVSRTVDGGKAGLIIRPLLIEEPTSQSFEKVLMYVKRADGDSNAFEHSKLNLCFQVEGGGKFSVSEKLSELMDSTELHSKDWVQVSFGTSRLNLGETQASLAKIVVENHCPKGQKSVQQLFIGKTQVLTKTSDCNA